MGRTRVMGVVSILSILALAIRLIRALISCAGCVMPSAATLDYARPHCPGTATNVMKRVKNHGLAKGTHEKQITQHLPCGKAMVYSHAAEGWECPDHGFVSWLEEAA